MYRTNNYDENNIERGKRMQLLKRHFQMKKKSVNVVLNAKMHMFITHSEKL